MEDFSKEYLKMPDEHWWYITRNEIIHLLIVKYFQSNKPYVIDIGCGCGMLVKYLCERGIKTKGIDNNVVFVEKAVEYGIDVKMGDVEKGVEVDEKFDVAVLSDVLEHSQFPDRFIKNVSLLIKEKGICIVFVPAFMFLWSWHDVVNSHKKRYTLSELKKLLNSHGFRVIFSSYWNLSSFFPVFIIRGLKKLLGIKTHDFYSFPSFINSFMTSLLKFENFLIKIGLRMPFGVSALCVGVKDQ